jgi:hypothetical protein
MATKIAPWGGSDFGTCLFEYYYTTKRAYVTSRKTIFS